MSRRVLVTGGGGFLGRAIVERCLARGWSVRSFSRGDYPELRALGVELHRGDLADEQAVLGAARGCEIVFHVAAKAGIWGPKRDYHLANVIGTQCVLAAGQRCGTPRFIHTSSPSVVFDGRAMEGVDESIPYPARFKSHYSETKAAAERLVLESSGRHGMRTLALRPHLIWGPRDNHITPRLLARARAGQLRQVGDGRNPVDTTYIDNAADAHLCAADALERDPALGGKAYFISNGDPRPLWEIINAILAAGGLEPVRKRISHRAAWTAGLVLEAVHGLLRLKAEPRMTRFVADELATAHWFDIGAARRDLGYEPRVSIEGGLARLKTWLAENSKRP